MVGNFTIQDVCGGCWLSYYSPCTISNVVYSCLLDQLESDDVNSLPPIKALN